MANTSSFLQRLLLLAASFFMFSTAQASSLDQAPDLTTYVVSGTTLMGINNLEYNGHFYDVSFVTGSCDSVFSGCNPASMVFGNAGTTLIGANASTALSEALFYYDQSAPFQRVNGCANASCYILTPTGYNATTGLASARGINQWYVVGQGGLAQAISTKNPDNLIFGVNSFSTLASKALPATPSGETWAVWTPVTSPVPETQTWAMMAAGLLMLACVTRKANRGR